jgi:dermatan 4-sulfotransferase 1
VEDNILSLCKIPLKRVRTLHPLLAQIDNRVDKNVVLKRSAVSNRYRYCYFRIPKCAHSTIMKTLSYYDKSVVFHEDDETGAKARREFKNMLWAKTLNLKSFSKKYFLFTFVRNPYARVLSAYLDKIANMENRTFDLERKAVMDNSDGKITFEGFIDYLEKGGLFTNVHWIPQTCMLPVKIDMLSFVGSVENLDYHIELIVKKIFNVKGNVNIFTREHGRQNANSLIKKFYNGKIAERVFKLYENDFVNFSYSRDFNILNSKG